MFGLSAVGYYDTIPSSMIRIWFLQFFMTFSRWLIGELRLNFDSPNSRNNKEKVLRINSSQSWFLLLLGLCLAIYGLWNFYIYSKSGMNSTVYVVSLALKIGYISRVVLEMHLVGVINFHGNQLRWYFVRWQCTSDLFCPNNDFGHSCEVVNGAYYVYLFTNHMGPTFKNLVQIWAIWYG